MLVCADVPAFAQAAGVWTVTPFAGAVAGGDLETGSASTGIALGVALSPHLALEGEISFARALEAITAQPDTRVVLGGGNLVYQPWSAFIAPYATGGVSLARLSRRLQGDGTGGATEVGFNLGGGGVVALGRQLSLRVDLWFFHLDNAPNFWRASAGFAVPLTR